MSASPSSFLPALEEALARRARWLESTQAPRLAAALAVYRSLFESIASTLVKKGILHEDPYNYDGKSRELGLPSDAVFESSNEDHEVSRRIAAYRRQLALLAEGMTFSLGSLDSATVAKVDGLLGYLDWAGFGEVSYSPTTRALSRAMTRVSLSADALSSRILRESQAQAAALVKEMRTIVSELAAWLRQSWKANVRAKALPLVPARRLQAADRAEALAAVKRAFEEALPGKAWWPELVQEMLAEEETEGGAVRRELLLKSLAVVEQRPEQAKPAAGHRAELLEGVLRLCQMREELAMAEEVLIANERELRGGSRGLLQRLRRWLRMKFGAVDERSYDIETRKSARAEPRTERISFLSFVAEMRELQGSFAELAESSSPSRRRAEALDEEALSELYSWQLRQLRRMRRRMEGLNSFFQVQAVNQGRPAPRSIKLGLLALENTIAKADELRKSVEGPGAAVSAVAGSTAGDEED